LESELERARHIVTLAARQYGYRVPKQLRATSPVHQVGFGWANTVSTI
jgi:hypothetical protein